MDWPKVTAALQAQAGLHGAADDFRADPGGDTVIFRAPGYSADVRIDPATGRDTATTDALGWVAAMGELHRSRDTGSACSVALDQAGYFPMVLPLTGTGMLLYLKKLRVSGVATFLLETARGAGCSRPDETARVL